MDEPPVPCLRCGSFASGDALPVRGIALCRDCLSGMRTKPDPISVVPVPAPLFLRKHWPPIVAGLLGGAAGARAALAWGVPVPLLAAPSLDRIVDAAFDASIGWLLGSLAGWVLAAIAFASHVHHAGNAQWKREALGALGLEGRGGGLALVLYARRPLGPRDQLAPSAPVEVGLLAQGDGLAFLGIDGTRRAIPASEIALAAAIRTYWWFPVRSALRLRLRDGSTLLFSWMEPGGFAANRAAAEEAAARLAASVAVARPSMEGPDVSSKHR